VDYVLQIKDGRMGYLCSVRDEVPHILGPSATTLLEWAEENRAA
jgi:NAD(P)H dehydrogenase (quinone)